MCDKNLVTANVSGIYLTVTLISTYNISEPISRSGTWSPAERNGSKKELCHIFSRQIFNGIVKRIVPQQHTTINQIAKMNRVCLHRGVGNREYAPARASEEAKEHGRAKHEEPDDVDEQQRLPRDERRSDVAEPALRHAGPRARGLGAAAPVRDPVDAADRVRAEAPHRAERGVPAPIRHGDRAGVSGFEG
jgi:hypothetical protein